MLDRNDILNEITRFRTEHGWSETTFGTHASDDTRLIERLRRGKVSLFLIERVQQFMAGERGTQRAERAKREAAE